VNVIRWIACAPAAVLSGLLVGTLISLASWLLFASVYHTAPGPAPVWVHLVSGICYGITAVLIAYVLAPTRHWFVALAIGVASVLFVLPALFASPWGTLANQPNVDGVGGVALGVMLGWALLAAMRVRRSAT